MNYDIDDKKVKHFVNSKDFFDYNFALVRDWDCTKKLKNGRFNRKQKS